MSGGGALLPAQWSRLLLAPCIQGLPPVYDIKRQREPWRPAGFFLEMIGLFEETDSKRSGMMLILGVSLRSYTLPSKVGTKS